MIEATKEIGKLSECLGSVPCVGDWRDYEPSMRIHIRISDATLVHYFDLKPKNPSIHALRHYFHCEQFNVLSHIQSEIIALSILSVKSTSELVKALEVALT